MVAAIAVVAGRGLYLRMPEKTVTKKIPRIAGFFFVPQDFARDFARGLNIVWQQVRADAEFGLVRPGLDYPSPAL